MYASYIEDETYFPFVSETSSTCYMIWSLCMKFRVLILKSTFQVVKKDFFSWNHPFTEVWSDWFVQFVSAKNWSLMTNGKENFPFNIRIFWRKGQPLKLTKFSNWTFLVLLDLFHLLLKWKFYIMVKMDGSH